MISRKLLFLDFDGVLNSHDWFKRRLTWVSWVPDGTRELRENRDICPDNMVQLNKLVEATGAEVVVSSTWRIGRTLEELRDILQRNGFQGTVIGMTPKLSDKREGNRYVATQRGDEIQAWMDANCQQQDIAFVILDDDSDMVHLKGHLVKTSMFQVGLCAHHVSEAILKLGEKCGVPVTKD